MFKAKIKNYQALVDEQIDVSGITVVVGDTDSGKSSIIRACEAGIYNKSGGDFVRLGQKAAEVSLDFAETPGLKPFKFTWKKPPEGGGTYDVNGLPLKKLGRSSVDIITENGFTEVMVCEKKERINFSRQDDESFLIFKSPTNIFDLISQFQKEKVLIPILESMAQDEKEILGALKEQESIASFLSEQITADNHILNALSGTPSMVIKMNELVRSFQKFEDLLNLVKEIESLAEKVESLDRECCLISACFKEYSRVVDSLKNVMSDNDFLVKEGSQIENLKKRLSDVEWLSILDVKGKSQVEKLLRESITKSEDLVRYSDKIDKTKEHISSIKPIIEIPLEEIQGGFKKWTDLNLIRADIQAFGDVVVTLGKNLKEAVSKFNNQKFEYDVIKEEYEKLKKEACPLCGRPF